MATVRKRSWTHEGKKKSAWVISYTDCGGKRRQVTCGSKKDADTRRLEIEVDLGTRSHVARSQTITVAEMCESFIRSCEDRHTEGRLARSTIASITGSVDKLIVPYMGVMKLTDLTASAILDWYKWMVRKIGNKPITARGSVKMLSRVLDAAMKKGFVGKNVALEALDDLKGIKTEEIEVFTIEEIKELLRFASTYRGQFEHYRAVAMRESIIYIGAFSGLRIGEIIALRPEDLDFERQLIRVRRTWNIHDGFKDPKTKAGFRDVPTPSIVMGLLQRWMSEYHIRRSSLVFSTHNGRVLHPTSFSEQYGTVLLKSAGLSPRHFHALRHFTASWLIMNGMALPDVARILGHSSYGITLKVYTRGLMNPSSLVAEVERTASLLLPVAHPMQQRATSQSQAIADPTPLLERVEAALHASLPFKQ